MKQVLLILMLFSAIFIGGCSTVEPESTVITESELIKADFVPAKDVKDADFWILEFEDGTKVAQPLGPNGADNPHRTSFYKVGKTYKVWKYESAGNRAGYHIDEVAISNSSSTATP